jgi:thiol-disulfide isomerase/thioredoxin
MKRFLLSFFAIASMAALSAQVTNYNVGATVTNFTVTDSDGNPHDLYSYTAEGKYVLLDFFFVACVPCQTTTPIFNEFYDKYGCNAGDVICISMNSGSDTDAEVNLFKEQFGGPFNHAPAISADGGAGAVTSNFGIAAYPTFTLIGPDNTMLNTDIWPLSGVETLENALPNGSGVTAMPCSVNVDELETAISGVSMFPNPTDGLVTMTYTLNDAQNVRISLFNLVGAEVAVIMNQRQMAGTHRLVRDFSELASGIYLLHLQNGSTQVTQRLVIR